ncbi:MULTISPECIES: MarR family winged helix-turn-helix transcriptional regulator [Enterococcus]|uniref:HTH marR-type domain-containing protein n=1 Tax=Candidatus Enterococcus ferrettii TaxID=2815324 RepID=A0ABV0EJX3_9ENTE|nr:MarR family transcriptional regulator [Enterococcus sp. 665A]MBO1338282.1 MarR family transcriptional regulator [Enterococcus sp. 665A]
MSEYTKELLQRLSYVGQASRRVMDAGKCEKKAPTQQLILDILAEENGLTSGVLAEILDVRPSSLTEVLNKLARRGEIERREDETDKRIKRVYITDEGRKKVSPSKQKEERSENFFAGLTVEEQHTLDQLLNKVITGWSEEFGDGPDFPNNPFDAIEALKEIRVQFDPMMNDFGRMTPHERRKLKRAWKEKMRNEFRGRGFGPNHFGPWDNDPRNNASDDQAPHENDWENW